jgi:hypothetical protein
MKKYLFVLILILIAVTLFGQESTYRVTKQDIDSFLAIVAEFREFAAKYVTDAASIDDIFDLYNKVMENTKAFNPFESFLKKKNWDFTKFSDFLLRAYSALIAINFYDIYGEPAEGDEGLDFAQDITKAEMDLVASYKDKLLALFPTTKMEGVGEPLDESYDDSSMDDSEPPDFPEE